MPSLVDYQVVENARFILPNDNDGIDKDFEFELPNDTRIVLSPLSWVVRTTAPNTDNTTYTIRLNDRLIISDNTLADPERRAMHALVGSIKKGPNKLVVARTSGSNSIEMDDIILWFQRDV